MKIEEEFFKAFGLKPYYLYYVFDLQGRKNEYCFKKEEFIDFVKKDKRYLLLKVEKRTPEITAEKLLQLICKEPFDFEMLKNDILERYLFLYNCEILKDELIQQVRKVFEREE